MKTNKYLLVVTHPEIRNLKVKNVNFLFPMEGYSVGFTNTYSLTHIKEENAYLYCNRIFDNCSLQSLKKDLQNLPKNIKGICFTDLGVLQLLKELSLPIEYIYMQNHNTTNAFSVNYYLEEVDSLLLSTDITKEEMLTILDQASKPLVVPYFMLVDAMYSRRKLLSNFEEEFHLPKTETITLQEPISKEAFLGVENEFGTMIYHQKYIDYRNIKHKNILYYYINPVGLTKEMVEKILCGEQIEKETHDGFLTQETYYCLKEVDKCKK